MSNACKLGDFFRKLPLCQGETGVYQGLVNVPFWVYWTSPYNSHLVDHIPFMVGWCSMGTSVMTHVYERLIHLMSCIAISCETNIVFFWSCASSWFDSNLQWSPIAIHLPCTNEYVYKRFQYIYIYVYNIYIYMYIIYHNIYIYWVYVRIYIYIYIEFI